MESSSSPKVCNGETDHERNHRTINGAFAKIVQAFGLHPYQGFWFQSFYLEGVKSAQEHFQAQASDVLLCSAPKSGTTWLKALVFAIFTRKQYHLSSNPLLFKVPHDCVPLLEVDLVRNSAREAPEFLLEINDPRPHDEKVEHRKPSSIREDTVANLLSTHIPYSSLPESVTASGCKIVYICRDPKDAFVSYWHFIRKARPLIGILPLKVMFELFCSGISYYGPYWDHVLGYWKVSLEQPERVLFLKYEDMKRDTSGCVRQLAEFVGRPFDAEEERVGLVEEIVGLCSFERLSNLEVNRSGKHRPETPVVIDNNAYFRKGEIGDSKNHLSDNMIRRMDEITEAKLGQFGLKFDP